MVQSAVVFSVSPFLVFTGLISLAVTIFCLVDVARRPDFAWQAAGSSKVLWIVLTIVAFFIGLLGLIIDLVYLLAIRPKVAAGGTGGGPMSGFGGYNAPGGYDGAPGGGYTPPVASYTPPGGGYGGAAYGAPAGGYSPPPPPGSPPPGWYPDPAGSGRPRYWNGQSWMEEGSQ